MENKFKLTTCSLTQDCTVTVLDNSIYDSSGFLAHQYMQSEVAFIDVLYPLNGTQYEQYILSTPYETNSFKLEKDSCYTVKHIIVPTDSWLKRMEKEGVNLDTKYSLTYFIKDNTPYKYIKGEIIKVDIDEIIELDADKITPISSTNNFVSICFLKKCYINLCKQILNNRGFSPCIDKSTIDRNLSYKRDIVWMTINVIKSLSDLNQLSEVQRLIDMLTNNCTGICTTSSVNTNSNDCGCSK